MMKRLLCFAATCATESALAGKFEAEGIGRGPVGWTCGATGGGTPQWTVEADHSDPDRGNVLRQSGVATFAWCVNDDTALTDGWVEVRFKVLGGREDSAGGVVWRWKDMDDYYVARANALENNVALYFTQGGARKHLKYVDAPVAAGVWNALRVEFAGRHISVKLNGTRYIELDDNHIVGSGKVGVWTKADSESAFDAFAYSVVQP